LAAFSAALAWDRSPNAIAPPATAETFTKFRLVVNLICSQQHDRRFRPVQPNYSVPKPSLAFVIDAVGSDALESSLWETSWVV
jgi:hypothetical protein